MSRLRAAVAALILSCTAGAAVAEAATVPVWTETGPLVQERYSASGVALPDGGALLIGGRPSGDPRPLASVERFNPATGRWLLASSLRYARNSASAITLRDGRVLVAGGEPQPIVYHDSTELYDPVTGVWTLGATMQAPRADFATVMLNDGRVLAVGGYHYDKADGAEIYDPAKDTWTLTSAPSSARANPAVAVLRDGRVLVAGGWSHDGPYGTYLETAELYDPVADKWTPLPAMAEKRMHASAALLPDGRVLVAGGSRLAPPPGVYLTSQTYEIFDPVAGTWSAAKPLVFPRAGGELVTLAGGQLAFFGGSEAVTPERYDAASDTWSEIPTGSTKQGGNVAIVLKDGSVLVTSGFGAGRLSQRLTFVEEPGKVIVDPVVEPTASPTPVPVPSATPDPKPAPVPGVAEVSVPKRLTASKAGAVTLRVRCVGQTGCTTRLSLRVRGGRTLGRADVKLAAGTSKTVKLTLSRADRRRLAGRSTKIVVTLGASTHAATLKVR